MKTTQTPTTGNSTSNSAIAAARNGIRLGEILVQQGLLTREEVNHVLQAQERQGRPFGVLAEHLFGLDPRCVESAWVKQYASIAGITDVGELEIDEECVTLINRRQAWQFRVAVVGREDGELVCVTDEKHLPRALRFAAASFREPTFFHVAQSAALESLLMEHYPVPQHLAQFAVVK